MTCRHCGLYQCFETGLCSICTEANMTFDFDSRAEFVQYMSKYHPEYTYVILSDVQFNIFVNKFSTADPPSTWYNLLYGLTQDFPHVFLSAAQVKQLICRTTGCFHVEVIYSRCYEPWDADVGHSSGDCYWRDLGSMIKPVSRIVLYKLYDRMFRGLNFQNFYQGECPICLEEMKSHYIWATKCCHKPIHKTCLFACESCPLCRGLYSAVKISKIDCPNTSL